MNNLKIYNNKSTTHLLYILSSLKCAVHWFKNNTLTFSFPDFTFENGIIVYKSYNHKNKNLYDFLTSYLLHYDVKYTKFNTPFLVYKDFVWKEDMFYSRRIPLAYIILEDVSYMGSKGCIYCQKYYEKKYKLLLKFCSRCTKLLQ
jgi:hypothetical protein